MQEYLPDAAAQRDRLMALILDTYTKCGFTRIYTPAVESAENLDKSDGGDNLNLIFKVLKRGEKLEEALASGDEKQLCDMGLRYDLTVPLSRFYAANYDSLPKPFKVIQTDRVFRAERPQKGRMREFVQCDIDILGDESPEAEIELIDVTDTSAQANKDNRNAADGAEAKETLHGTGAEPSALASGQV
jgi:histidyl-tRNA synthetase